MSSVSSKDISDCVSIWLSYLQMLNGLCSAGSRLSQGLQILLGSSHGHTHAAPMAANCRTMWDDLARVTAATTAAVKSGIVTALQESALRINTSDTSKPHDIGEVACASLTTFINMQYQFCLAFCECLRGVKTARPLVEPREDCAQSSCRQSLTPVQQRRWSEEVAPKGRSASVPEADTGPRRWSMPWESGGSQGNRLAPSVPASFPPPLPLLAHSGIPRETSHRSGSTTPESNWQGSSLASMEDLQGVIHLLSCQPGTSVSNCNVTHLHQPSRHIPGVTLTSCSLNEKDFGSSLERELEMLGVPPIRDKYSTFMEDISLAADEELGRLLTGSQSHASSLLHPSSLSRATSGSLNLPGLQPWCEGDGTSNMGNIANSSSWTPASADGGGPSRKSSTSTDSSSAYSRSAGSEGSGDTRSHLYCMWKGEAPFIQLTESLVEGDALCESLRQTCIGSRISSGKLDEEVDVTAECQAPIVQTSFGEEKISSHEADENLRTKDRA